MNQTVKMRWLTLAAVAVMGVGAANARAADTVVEGFTEPSQHLKLSFYGTGVIKDVLVKEGQVVKAGTPLLGEDDRIEAKRLESMYGDAHTEFRVKAAEADYRAKKSKYERLAKILKGNGDPGSANAASQSEVDEAQAEAEAAEAGIGIAKNDLAQKKAEYEAQKIKVDLMKLTVPVDAVVERLDLQLGEVVDPTKPACTVVVNDPLWVRLPLPTNQAQHLKVGDSLQVSYDGKAWYPAKVIFRSPLASAASETQDIRLELPNTLKQDSGLKIMVKLPEAVAGAAETAAAK